MLAQRVSMGRIALRGRRSPISGPFRAQWQRGGRRGYAASESGGAHPVKQAGSDLPWLITSVGITVPVCWYLLQQKPSGGHGLSHHHDIEHQKAEEEANHDEEPAEEGEEHVKESQDADEHTDEVPNAGETDDAATDAGDDQEDAPKEPTTEDFSSEHAAPEASSEEHHDDEKAEDHQDQMSAKEEADQEAARTPERASVSTDVSEKKYNPEEAPAPRVQGPTKHDYPTGGYPPTQTQDTYGKTDSYAEEDRPATAKAAKGYGHQSGKQDKWSNSDTKYAWDLNKDENFSKKAEGQPDSAKVKGTVDPRRPQGM